MVSEGIKNFKSCGMCVTVCIPMSACVCLHLGLSEKKNLFHKHMHMTIFFTRVLATNQEENPELQAALFL